jgi:SET domain-containing protein
MSNSLEVRRVRGKGRGVFATRSFRAGETIDVCPVIPLTRGEATTCSATILDDYFFEWGPKRAAYALALGYGSIFNHSDDPNAAFECRTRQLQITFRATRHISRGEQITIDYQWPKTVKMRPPRF